MPPIKKRARDENIVSGSKNENVPVRKKKRAKMVIAMGRWNWPFLLLSIAFSFSCVVSFGHSLTRDNEGIITLMHDKLSLQDAIPIPVGKEITYETALMVIKQCSRHMDLESFSPFIVSHMIGEAEAIQTGKLSDYAIVTSRLLKHHATVSMFSLEYLVHSVDSIGRWTFPTMALRAHGVFAYHGFNVLLYMKDIWYGIWNVEPVSQHHKARKAMMRYSNFNWKGFFRTFCFGIISIVLVCMMGSEYKIIDVLMDADIAGLDNEIAKVMKQVKDKQRRATQADADRVERSFGHSEPATNDLFNRNKTVAAEVKAKITNPGSIDSITSQFKNASMEIEIENPSQLYNEGAEDEMQQTMIKFFHFKQDEQELLEQNADYMHYMQLKS